MGEPQQSQVQIWGTGSIQGRAELRPQGQAAGPRVLQAPSSFPPSENQHLWLLRPLGPKFTVNRHAYQVHARSKRHGKKKARWPPCAPSPRRRQ